jgi:hypothetical protein
VTRSYTLRTRASCARCTLCLYLPYVCGNRVVSWYIAVAAQGSTVQQHTSIPPMQRRGGVGGGSVEYHGINTIHTLYTLHPVYPASTPAIPCHHTALIHSIYPTHSLHIPYPLPPYSLPTPSIYPTLPTPSIYPTRLTSLHTSHTARHTRSRASLTRLSVPHSLWRAWALRRAAAARTPCRCTPWACCQCSPRARRGWAAP